jgi:hypothetical protein
MFKICIVILSFLVSVSSQICDKYTSSNFGVAGNNRANQEIVITLLVNTALAGNVDFPWNKAGNTDYSGIKASQTILNADNALNRKGSARLNVTVHGILNLSGKGTYSTSGNSVYTGDLFKYFNGSGATTNVGNVAKTVNFIDIGIQESFLTTNYFYSAGQMQTKQYFLMQHLYQLFAQLLECTVGFPTYQGNPSMWSKHRFMQLTNTENMYFIYQVSLAAKSFGVSIEDTDIMVKALIALFNRKDSPAVAIKVIIPIHTYCITLRML